MKMEEFASLFQPLKIGDITIKNRIIQCPMDVMPFVDDDMEFGQRYARILEERAKGEVGLIITGACLVEGTNGRMFSDVKEVFVPNALKMTKKIHSYGAKIFCQLSAGVGRNLVIKEQDINGGGIPLEFCAVAPSDGTPNVWNPKILHRALDEKRIRSIVEGFADAAEMLADSGFDGVEVHALHEGYLLDQFAIASLNKRKDQYGGNLENRLRFTKEILEAVKARCGKGFPVIIRLSGESKMKGLCSGALPGEKYHEFGRSLKECKEIAMRLQEMGYDALDMDNGSYDAWYWAHPPVYMPMMCNLKEAEEVKKAVDIPVFCAGRMDDPWQAAEALNEKRIDGIAIGRALLADAYWAQKIQRGELEQIRPCIACQNGCMRTFLNRPLTCALNPMIGCGNEIDPPQARDCKAVLVVGGGIGGMEAARTAAMRGHKVKLVEKNDQLGGVFVAAATPGFKEADQKLIAWYKNELKNLKIPVMLGIEANIDFIHKERPDIVAVCTGAKKRSLPIEGGEFAVDAIDFLLQKRDEIKKIAIVGGGLTGCEIAYYAAQAGKQVALLEMKEDILLVDGLCKANSDMLKDLLRFYGVKIITNAVIEKIEPGGCSFKKGYLEQYVDAEMVVNATGYDHESALYDGLKKENIRVLLIGDAKKSGNLMTVIHDAYEMACMI